MNQIETLLLNCSHFRPDASELKKLVEHYPELRVTVADEPSYTIMQLAKAQIVVGFPKPGDLVHAEHLRWLQTPSAGVGQYSNKALFRNKDILLTSAVGTYGKQIADHVLGMIIAFNHYFFTYQRQMETHHWQRYFPTHDIWESTILLIGFGDIGKNIAIRAKAHGMQVLAVKRTMTEKPPYVDELYTTESLDDLLSRADYVVLCVASTPQTENILDERRIGLMKQGSYLINVARGALADQEALVQALQEGRLAGAGLDATEPEPLPPEHPLWRMPNVFITPHASGMSLSDPHQVFDIFFKNLGRYLNGQPMRNLVDFDRRY
jgi:phosphoglycerate dehydrogenase-like enzyme